MMFLNNIQNFYKNLKKDYHRNIGIVLETWKYKINEDNTYRFILGTKGKNPLVVFGINPSTAEPNNLDRTLIQVRNRSIKYGFDSWIMFNIYPQRATDPNLLDLILNNEMHKTNLKEIKKLFLLKGNYLYGQHGAI